jgi:hypothetical protein
MLTSTNKVIAIVVACVVFSTIAWAVIGPDSIWNNQVMDKIQVQSINDCGLYRIKQGTGDYALLCVAGWQANRPLSLETAHRCFDEALVNLEAIDRSSDIRVWEEISVYFFLYDTAQSPEVVGEKLYRCIEGDAFLTKASTRYIFLTHSLGGWVSAICELAEGGRKSLGSLNAGTPWLGTPLADQGQIEGARDQIYTKVGETLVGALMSKVDFNTPSFSWLRPSSVERQAMLKKVDFSNKFLYVGACEPSSNGVISRNLNLLAIFDAWSWKSDAMRDKQAYGLGANFISQLGCGGSDGVVPILSALADGYADNSRVVAVGMRNHSQVITGNQGDVLLHQLMYRDLVSLLPVKRKETEDFGKFDLWMPEVPIFDLPVEWRQKISRSQLVFSKEGVLTVMQYSGNQQQEIGTRGIQSFWPKWIGDNAIIFTGEQDGYTDIYLIGDNLKLVRLTHDGGSRWAVPIGGGLSFVMQSEGRLVLGSVGGLRQTLIKDQLCLQDPPVVIGKKVYFAHASSPDKYDLYWVSVNADGYSLSQAKLVAESTIKPLNLAGALVAVNTSDDELEVTFLTKKWLQAVSVPVQCSSFYDLSQFESIVAEGSFIYIVCNGGIRLVDQSVVEKSIATVSLPSSIDKVLPVIAYGFHLDAR